MNRLTSIASALSTLGYAYSYNDANQRTRVNLADDSFWNYEYDALGQVKSGKRYWSDWTPVAGQQFEYGFDDIGNRTSTKAGGDQTGASLRSASYTANNLNQITQRDVPAYLNIIGAATATATNVNVNNVMAYRRGEYYRVELNSPNTSAAVWQSGTNRAVQSGTTNSVTGNLFLPKTAEAFSYDADGNLTNDGRRAYVWDAENRLIRQFGPTTGPSGSVKALTYGYDWQGRRISKTVSNYSGGSWNKVLDEKYLYDRWNLLASLNASNNAVVFACLWGSDLSGTMQGAGGVGGSLAINAKSASVTFAAYDGNGNVTALVNAAGGDALANYEYGPFGELIRCSGSAAKANPFRFSTKFQDDETEFLYYGYRYHNPSIGRWLSRDPLEELGGKNLYAFVYNNPNSFVDTDGRYGWSDLKNDWNGAKDWAGDAWDRTAGTWDNAVFFKDWVFDQGSANREYGENDRLTRLLMESNGAKDMVSQYRKAGCPPTRSGSYGTIQGYKDTFFHWGFLNPAEWQIGGYLYTVSRIGPCKVKYTVVNSATRRSFFGEPTLRGWANRVGINWSPWGLHPRDQVSWGGEIKQTFTWTDVDPCCCGKKKTRQE